MKSILILGGSGFIGQALYKELNRYYKTYGTYYSQEHFNSNQQFHYWDVNQPESLRQLLDQVRPKLIISALKGPFDQLLSIHKNLCAYIQESDCRLMWFSTVHVFDTFRHFPSYEHDKTLSESLYGRYQIKIENEVLKLPVAKRVIVRMPMIFGQNSPRIQKIDRKIHAKDFIEVFPNTVLNANSILYFRRQVHYLINQQCSGIYHLGSSNLVTHEELMRKIIERRHLQAPKLKQVFTSNALRYLALLPKQNKLPDHLYPTIEDILEEVDLLRRNII